MIVAAWNEGVGCAMEPRNLYNRGSSPRRVGTNAETLEWVEGSREDAWSVQTPPGSENMTRAEKGYPGTPGEPYSLHRKKGAALQRGEALEQDPPASSGRTAWSARRAKMQADDGIV